MRNHERYQLEQKKERLQTSIAKLAASHAEKMEALKHEKNILSSKLEKISALNAKMLDRLGGVRTEAPVQQELWMEQ